MALQKDVVSLSLRRAWIEICCINIIDDSFRSLSLRRAWIEIARTWEPTRRPDGRSPYGERGLKSRLALHRPTARLSLSLRRAWIEITSRPLPPPTRSSLSLRRAWIEIARANASDGPSRSLSLRRAWIEIARANASDGPSRSLSLRRAWIEITIRPFVIGWPCRSPYGERGLKFGAPAEPERDDASLSLRRAWIEIPGRCRFSRSTSVALLTESVD